MSRLTQPELYKLHKSWAIAPFIWMTHLDLHTVYLLLPLPVQACFNRCFIGVHSFVHTLKSNNRDQFDHKAVAREGKQPFPLNHNPAAAEPAKLHTPAHLCVCVCLCVCGCVCVCVRAGWVSGTGPLCSFLFCLCSNVTCAVVFLLTHKYTLTYTHTELSGQSTVETTSCSPEASFG